MVISRTGLGLETTNVTDTWPERGHETIGLWTAIHCQVFWLENGHTHLITNQLKCHQF